jgi:hypothetical protein
MRLGLDARLVLGVLAMLVTQGCAPIRVWTVPELSGTLRRKGVPVAGATIRWVNMASQRASTGDKVDGSAMTGPRGEFAVQGKRAWGLVSFLPADAWVYWRVEAKVDTHTTTLWQQTMSVGPRNSGTPSRFQVACDMSEAPRCILLEADESWYKPLRRPLPTPEPPPPKP